MFNFFQSKIEELYPLDESPTDPLQIQRDAHEVGLILSIKSLSVGFRFFLYPYFFSYETSDAEASK